MSYDVLKNIQRRTRGTRSYLLFVVSVSVIQKKPALLKHNHINNVINSPILQLQNIWNVEYEKARVSTYSLVYDLKKIVMCTCICLT